jgi:hypothetical protein
MTNWTFFSNENSTSIIDFFDYENFTEYDSEMGTVLRAEPDKETFRVMIAMMVVSTALLGEL